MKVYVTKMPKSKEECFFCQDDTCGICKKPCVIEECYCLEQLVVSVTDAEVEDD